MSDAVTTSRIVELRPNIYLIKAEKPGSHVYLIKGNNKNVLIDTGMTADFPRLKACLRELSLKPRDVHFIILTHEHFDHIGATTYFFDTAVVAAHRLAANKIELQDEFVTMMKYCNVSCRPFHADLWLEEGSLIDLGSYKLHTLHTPGHTSGCICVYEIKERLLFTGDTVFGGGTLSGITSSGNISDYMSSLQRLSALRVEELYPGHGKPSVDPLGDILRGLEHARVFFDDTKILFDTLARKWSRQEMLERALGRLSTGKGK
jgi:glyoxylase-like metal-dependent hydrolase (beta-lactamase superfamily II)